MTEEERREEETREEPETELQSEQLQPTVVYRPIEVEVNLLRRKLNALIFLALIVSLGIVAVLGGMYRSRGKQITKLQVESQKISQERGQILDQAQRQGLLLRAILGEMDLLRKTNVGVAAIWNKYNLSSLVRPGTMQAQPTTEEAAPDTQP